MKSTHVHHGEAATSEHGSGRVSVRRMIVRVLTASALACAGCGDDAPSIPDGCNVYDWKPEIGDMTSFPTSDFLVEDESTATGFRAHMSEDADLTAYGPLAPLFSEYALDLDGVGVQSEMWLGFTGTFDPALLPVADGAAHATDSVGIVVLPEDGPPRLVPVVTRTSTQFIYVRPLTPLPEATRVAYFATRGLSAAAGGCLEPGSAMRDLLRRPDAHRREAIDALTELGVIDGSHELVALHAVTTQSITRESVAIAAHIATLEPTFADATCTDEGTYRRCSATLTVEDYRGENGGVDVDVDHVVPDKTWAVPVTAWLPPAEMAGPHPTIVFGHGLTSSRNQANAFAPGFAARGWTTVAIDAVVHGSHPSTGGVPASGLAATFRFFGVVVGDPDAGTTSSMDARRLRDHFRQSTYDKLQLTRALVTAGDLDGDGTSDVDPSRLVSFGVSLGGIMSSELLALSDAFAAAINMEGGGCLTRTIFDEDASFGVLVLALLGDQPPDVTAQSFSAMQMVLDRGDGASYARHILRERIRPASSPPDYVFGVAVDDIVVTNAASYALARALGVPLVGPVLDPVLGLEVSGHAVPLSGNGPGGASVGLLQFDVVEVDDAVVEATHDNMPISEVGRALIDAFLESHFAEGTATIIDPYAQVGLPHGLPSP